jgi:hypothetical protein
MMFSSNAFRFVLVLAAACNAVSTTAAAEPTVELGFAEDYVILTKAGISTVPNSVITGDIAVSPIAATAMTGFSLSADSTNVFSTSTPQLTGHAFAANYANPTPAKLTTAVGAMETAYTDAAGRPNADGTRINLGNGILGGLDDDGNIENNSLTPGVYTFNTGDVTIAGDISFTGNADDIFIIQITGDLQEIDGVTVHLADGALAKNIFWQVAGKVLVGAGAHMEGILLVKTNILFETESSMNGRVLAQTRCDLQKATITQPAGAAEPTQRSLRGGMGSAAP